MCNHARAPRKQLSWLIWLLLSLTIITALWLVTHGVLLAQGASRNMAEGLSFTAYLISLGCLMFTMWGYWRDL